MSIVIHFFLYAIRVQQSQCRHEKKCSRAALISSRTCTFLFFRFLPIVNGWYQQTPLLYSIHVKANKWLQFFDKYWFEWFDRWANKQNNNWNVILNMISFHLLANFNIGTYEMGPFDTQKEKRKMAILSMCCYMSFCFV